MLGNKFEDVPVDTRHIEARMRKSKIGAHRTGRRPTLKDFPQEWLPSMAEGAKTQPITSQ